MSLHNVYVNFTFPRKRERNFSNLSWRFGVNNVFVAEPPLTDADVGYQRAAGTNPRSQAHYGQLSKRF